MQIFRRRSLDDIIANAEKKKLLNTNGILGKWDRNSNIMAIDFETAHFFDDIYKQQYSSACQVGIAFYNAGTGEIKTSSSLIKPDPFKMDPGNFQIHGISLEFLEDAPLFNKVYEDLILPNIQNSTIMIAHNAPFDTRVLFNALRFYKMDIPNIPCVCTLDMSKKKTKATKHSLDALCKLYGIELEHHEACSDALACLKIFERFADKGLEYCAKSVEKMMGSKS